MFPRMEILCDSRAMPDRIRVFLAQTRRPIPPAVLTTPPRRAEAKSMVDRWAEYKRVEKGAENNPQKEDSGGSRP